jgi:hypothetical protein
MATPLEVISYSRILRRSRDQRVFCGALAGRSKVVCFTLIAAGIVTPPRKGRRAERSELKTPT